MSHGGGTQSCKKCIDLATSMPLPRINTALQKVLMVMSLINRHHTELSAGGACSNVSAIFAVWLKLAESNESKSFESKHKNSKSMPETIST
jgi:hypothetical protein